MLKDSRLLKMETQITQVGEKLQLILTSGVVNSLSQYVQQNPQVEIDSIPASLSSSTVNNSDAQLNPPPPTLSVYSAEVVSQPMDIQEINLPSISNADTVSQSTVTQEIGSQVLQPDVPVEDSEVEIITNTSAEIANTSIDSAAESDMLTPADLVPIYVKSCSRRNFAVLLVRRLVDKDVRRRSNVNGKGKEKLNPEVIRFVKSKCFEYYPSQPADIKKEWSLCIITIDESCRRLNKLAKTS